MSKSTLSRMFDALRPSPSNPATAQVKMDQLPPSPTEAWEILKSINTVNKVEPVDLNIPIYPDKVRFVCISDTHSLEHRMTHRIPPGDVLIHAGDFTNTGELKEIRAFNELLGTLPHPHKIVIVGNHELSFDEKTVKSHPCSVSTDADPSDVRAMLTNCTFLEDSSVQLFGLNIYGSPWQPRFGGWAFNLARGKDCLDKWNLIPTDTDILITHGPPIGHGDLCASGQMAGCVDLLQTIQERVKPKYHIFGHIHEGYGITTNGTTTFINASICNLAYRPCNPPIIFDIPLPLGTILISRSRKKRICIFYAKSCEQFGRWHNFSLCVDKVTQLEIPY